MLVQEGSGLKHMPCETTGQRQNCTGWVLSEDQISESVDGMLASGAQSLVSSGRVVAGGRYTVAGTAEHTDVLKPARAT